MKTRNFVLGICCLLVLGGVAMADRQLDRAEVLQIFEQLTSQPKKTWISAGTIEAAHEEHAAAKTTNQTEIDNQITQAVQAYQNNPNKRELTPELQKMKLDAIPFNVRYRLSNQYTMNSTVVVKYDGNRFSWDISVTSRTDSVKPASSLAGNFMTDQFDLSWNARRTFTWDGQKYTMYSRSGNYAVADTTGSIPHVVRGPLTAGLVPWGYDRYTYASLSAAGSSAVEETVGGQTQVDVTVDYSDGVEIVFVLDPQKDYALVSRSTKGMDTTYSTQYGGYQMVSGRWVPTTISINRYDSSTNRALGYDIWTFTMISTNPPSFESFNVAYAQDALVEFQSSVTAAPSIYRSSQMIDTDLLLADRLSFAASKGTQPQNCATAALKYAASRLGRDLTDQQLAELVDGTDHSTSLYAMENFAMRQGLYCRAVRTDIQGLRNLNGAQAILYIPGKDHFVALGDIDNQYVWSVDLAKDKFCYRSDVSFFDMDWTGGVALLISDRPIKGAFNDIDSTELRKITGRSGYSCTELLQEYDVIFCSMLGGTCMGYYEYYPTRYGCEEAPSGMCIEDKYLRSAESPCLNDMYDLTSCDTGDWTFYYMRACS
jgi:Peptidase C39 family